MAQVRERIRCPHCRKQLDVDISVHVQEATATVKVAEPFTLKSGQLMPDPETAHHLHSSKYPGCGKCSVPTSTKGE